MIHTYKRQAEMEIFLMQLLEVSLSDDSLGGFHYLLHETLTPFSKMKQKVIKIHFRKINPVQGQLLSQWPNATCFKWELCISILLHLQLYTMPLRITVEPLAQGLLWPMCFQSFWAAALFILDKGNLFSSTGCPWQALMTFLKKICILLVQKK